MSKAQVSHKTSRDRGIPAHVPMYVNVFFFINDNCINDNPEVNHG